MKALTPHFWRVQAAKRPTKLVKARDEREAKSRSGYKGFRGHAAQPLECAAKCHDFITMSHPAFASDVGPMGVLVCSACNEHLQRSWRNTMSRIEEIEKAIVDLRKDLAENWEQTF